MQLATEVVSPVMPGNRKKILLLILPSMNRGALNTVPAVQSRTKSSRRRRAIRLYSLLPIVLPSKAKHEGDGPRLKSW